MDHHYGPPLRTTIGKFHPKEGSHSATSLDSERLSVIHRFIPSSSPSCSCTTVISWTEALDALLYMCRKQTPHTAN